MSVVQAFCFIHQDRYFGSPSLSMQGKAHSHGRGDQPSPLEPLVYLKTQVDILYTRLCHEQAKPKFSNNNACHILLSKATKVSLQP